MRLGEICRIKVEHIDFEKKIDLIGDHKDPARKLGNDQIVPLLPEAWTSVTEITEGRNPGRVFAYNSCSVSAAFTRSCKTLGINDLRFDDLRHKAAADFLLHF